MAEDAADFITILSSDMIADIVQVYFDTELYTNKKVKIVDLKPQGDGYAFSLAFTQVLQTEISKKEISTLETINSYTALNAEQVAIIKAERDSNSSINKVIQNGIAITEEAKVISEDVINKHQRNSKGRFVKHEADN